MYGSDWFLLWAWLNEGHAYREWPPGLSLQVGSEDCSHFLVSTIKDTYHIDRVSVQRGDTLSEAWQRFVSSLV